MTDEDSAPKSFLLSTELHAYLLANSSPLDDVLHDLAYETAEATGRWSQMQVAPEQGLLLTLLTRLSGARRAVEVGTFTGYSALCIARGLPDDGVLVCCDVSEEWTSMARRYWERAGVGHKVDLRLGPAAETLAAMPAEPNLDLAFIDADKAGYRTYYEELLARLRPGGLILVDNVLWGGRVLDETDVDADTAAIRAFNEAVAADTRVEAVMLPVSDGLTLVRKR